MFASAGPESWAKLVVQYQLEDRQLSFERLSEVVSACAPSDKEVAKAALEGSEESETSAGFLLLYELFTSTELRLNGQPRDGAASDELHDLATMLASMHHLRLQGERDNGSILAEILAVLATNPELCRSGDVPRLVPGPRNDRGSEDARVWRVDAIDDDDSEGEVPLDALLKQVVAFFGQHSAQIVWPAYRETPRPQVAVAKSQMQLGLFARRPEGLQVSKQAKQVSSSK